MPRIIKTQDKKMFKIFYVDKYYEKVILSIQL